tara:strand:- start:910 stop:1464 length:555 start_codon:yes stop_codon:yes gene_type:complete
VNIYKLPLALTLSRFVIGILVPVFIVIGNNPSVAIAAGLFVIGALSDAADGAVARRRSQQTPFGAFLDPIADKFLVFMVLIALVYVSDSLALLVLGLIIIAREMFVMSLREWASSRGIQGIVQVAIHGKIKAVMQMAGISLVISVPLVSLDYFREFSISILAIGTLIGVYSGVLYSKSAFKSLG